MLILGFKSDVWALGVLLFRMLCGRYPFASKKNRALMREIVKEDIDYGKTLKLRYVVLLKKMLDKNPQKRISVNQIMKYLRET